MGEHTPGPWHASRRARFVNTVNNHPVVEVIGERQEFEANARLIAAAPDMLAALIALGQLLDFDDPLRPGDLSIEDPSSVNAAFAKARAAIAKAT